MALPAGIRVLAGGALQAASHPAPGYTFSLADSPLFPFHSRSFLLRFALKTSTRCITLC